MGQALNARELLGTAGINAGVAKVHTLKPLDGDFVRTATRSYPLLVTVENHSIVGGLGSAVAEVVAETGSGAAAQDWHKRHIRAGHLARTVAAVSRSGCIGYCAARCRRIEGSNSVNNRGKIGIYSCCWTPCCT